jgi:hypothetical protein
MSGRPFTRFGFAIVLFGVLLDIVGHGVGDPASAGLGHVVVISGMVLSLAGVVIDGVRQPRPMRPPREAVPTEVDHAIR